MADICDTLQTKNSADRPAKSVPHQLPRSDGDTQPCILTLAQVQAAERTEILAEDMHSHAQN